MSKNRLVNTQFWTDNYISELSANEKLLFLYFLTNPSTTICGVYEMTVRRMGFDTGIDQSEIRDALEKFDADKKISYIEGYVIVWNFVKHQKKNTSINLGIQEELKTLPASIKAIINIDDNYCIPKFNQRLAIAIRDKFTCAYCKKIITHTSDLEIDHVHPESRGGSTTYKNLVTACFSCNQTKSDRTAEEFGYKDIIPKDYHANIAAKELKEDANLLKQFNLVFEKNLKLIQGELLEVKASQTDIEGHHLNLKGSELKENSNLNGIELDSTPYGIPAAAINGVTDDFTTTCSEGLKERLKTPLKLPKEFEYFKLFEFWEGNDYTAENLLQTFDLLDEIRTRKKAKWQITPDLLEKNIGKIESLKQEVQDLQNGVKNNGTTYQTSADKRNQNAIDRIALIEQCDNILDGTGIEI